MTDSPQWLPELLSLDNWQGNWSRYLDDIYGFFLKGFVDTDAALFENRVTVESKFAKDGKHVVFWHLISEGKEEDSRMPDTRRCERIQWPRAIIDHASAAGVLYWETRKKRQKRAFLWLRYASSSYLVVLRKGGTYYQLITAYPVTRDHTDRKLLAEYKGFETASAAPGDDARTPSTHGR